MTPFLNLDEDILTFFKVLDYGSCAMTLRGQASTGNDGCSVTDVYHTFQAAFEETGFTWNV
jgi:hypothetical protein